MTLESLLALLLDNLPENVELDFPLPDLQQFIPAQLDILEMLKYLAFFALGSFVLGLVGRIFFGKRSELNHALSSSMGILFIYVLTIVIYTFRPWELDRLLSPLPFVAFSEEYLCLFSFMNGSVSAICYEILAMLILSFLVNLLDSFVTRGDSVVGWYFLRFVTVLLAMLCHLAIRWVFSTYLPDVLVAYAPMILLGVLAALLLLGVLNVILGVVLTAVEPVLGAIYTFFFSNIVGKQLTKAVVTTAVLTILAFALEYFGITVVNIAEASLVGYIPLVLVLLGLWYVIGHVL